VSRKLKHFNESPVKNVSTDRKRVARETKKKSRETAQVSRASMLTAKSLSEDLERRRMRSTEDLD
jgi:hypothetical protein